MAWTTTSQLADSLEDMRHSARSVREYEGKMSQLVDKHTLPEGEGLSWNELTYTQLTAQAITETTDLDNPQSPTDSLLTITPTVVGIETFLTDRVQARISKKGLALVGKLGQQAMQRKKDEDGLSLFSSGATSCEPGAGATMTSSYVASASARIKSNSTEPGRPPIYWVAQGYHIKDIYDELVAGVGTYTVPDGITARVFQEGFRLPIAGVEVYEDGNITVDGSDDAVGGVFAKESIVLVQGRAARVATVRSEKRGGGGDHVYHYDEYAYGERNSPNWLYRMKADATAPTS